MDKASLLDIMAFTDFAWADVEKTFGADNEALVREAPGSGWPALRNCLAHILRGRYRWNEAIINLKAAAMPDLDDGALMTWAELNAYREETGRRLTDFLSTLDEVAMQEKLAIDIEGTPLQYSRAELALHLVLHEISHHGDISNSHVPAGNGAVGALLPLLREPGCLIPGCSEFCPKILGARTPTVRESSPPVVSTAVWEGD